MGLASLDGHQTDIQGSLRSTDHQTNMQYGARFARRTTTRKLKGGG